MSRTSLSAAILVSVAAIAFAQDAAAPVNDAPNPYQTVADFFKMPAGRTWGSTSAVEVDKDGRSIWVGERCGANTCLHGGFPGAVAFTIPLLLPSV